MKYIEQIDLVNFQSHERTSLTLSPGVNVIVGPSDSGKTSILRALRWCLFNEPAGVEFVREGETEVSVTVRFRDGIAVTRRRTKSKNQYVLKDQEGEETVFEGFGKNVPEEVEDALGIRKVFLDDKKAFPLNFSDQLDGPFLLQETDAYKAQAIGRMVGIDILDEAMRDAQRDVKQLALEKSVAERDLEALSEEEKTFSYLEGWIDKREQLKRVIASIDALLQKEEKLRDMVVTAQRIRAEKARVSQILADSAGVDAAGEKLHMIREQFYRYDKYHGLSVRRTKNIAEKSKTKNILATFRDFDRFTDALNRLSSAYTRYRKILPYRERSRALTLEKANLKRILSDAERLERIPANRINELYGRLLELKSLQSAKADIADRIERGKAFLEGFSTIDSAGERRDLLIKKHQAFMQRLAMLEEKESLNRQRKIVQAQYDQAKSDLSADKAAYLEALKHVGRCPLCRQTIDEESLREISLALEE